MQFRNVRLKRHPDGGLGFSVKGGVEHNLPILVSKVCRNEDDDHLYIGDAILKVNHRSLGAVTHDEALDLLRGAGDQVSLTVKHYKSAAPFLLKQLRQMIPEMDDAAKGTASPYTTVFSSLRCPSKTCRKVTFPVSNPVLPHCTYTNLYSAENKKKTWYHFFLM